MICKIELHSSELWNYANKQAMVIYSEPVEAIIYGTEMQENTKIVGKQRYDYFPF